MNFRENIMANTDKTARRFESVEAFLETTEPKENNINESVRTSDGTRKWFGGRFFPFKW